MERLPAICRWALLLLVAWPGPRPVVHSHADYLCRRHNALLLAQHLALFHEPSESPGAAHCHWLIHSFGGDAAVVSTAADVVRAMSGACVSELPPALSAGWMLSPVVAPPLGRWSVDEPLADWQSRHAFGLAFHRQFCAWLC